jgi:hypothetical protein
MARLCGKVEAGKIVSSYRRCNYEVQEGDKKKAILIRVESLLIDCFEHFTR